MKTMKQNTVSDQDIACRIKTRGSLDQDWLACFEGLSVEFDGQASTVRGVSADQAALRGLLNCLWDLNLTVLSVTTANSPHSGEGGMGNE